MRECGAIVGGRVTHLASWVHVRIPLRLVAQVNLDPPERQARLCKRDFCLGEGQLLALVAR